MGVTLVVIGIIVWAGIIFTVLLSISGNHREDERLEREWYQDRFHLYN